MSTPPGPTPSLYTLPAEHITPGLSTADGQLVLDVAGPDGQGCYYLTVYTPRPDDPQADAHNRATPEIRCYRARHPVRLASIDTARDHSTSTGEITDATSRLSDAATGWVVCEIQDGTSRIDSSDTVAIFIVD